MLYPIELLRHKSAVKKRGAMDGVHVNGRARICHVVRRLFKCRHKPRPCAELFTVQIASSSKSHPCKLQQSALPKNNLIHCF